MTSPTLELLTSLAPDGSDKPPVVFVHGACHAAWCWENYLPYFAAAGHDAYALSLRGHGASEGRAELDSFGLDDYVADVHSVVSGLDRKPVLVGHSMGGAVVQKFLADHSDSIVAAVLLAPATVGGLKPAANLRTAVRTSPRGMRATIAINRGKPASAAGVAVSPFFSGRISLDDAARYGALLQPESSLAVEQLAKPYTDDQSTSVPVMVIGSRHDPLFGAASLTTTATAYGVEPVILDDLCHDLMLDPEWQGAAQLVVEFIAASVPVAPE